MLRTEAYASELGTLSDARRLFGNVARGTTSLRGKGTFWRERNARTGAREEGGKEGNASFLLSLLARPLCFSRAKNSLSLPFQTPTTQARGVRHTLKHSEERHPKMGELLVIKLEDKNSGKWRIGVVTDLIKGRDGVVRAAKLRVGTSCIERAVQQLFPLEFCCDRVRDEANKPTPLRVEAPEFSRHEILSLQQTCGSEI